MPDFISLLTKVLPIVQEMRQALIEDRDLNKVGAVPGIRNPASYTKYLTHRIDELSELVGKLSDPVEAASEASWQETKKNWAEAYRSGYEEAIDEIERVIRGGTFDAVEPAIHSDEALAGKKRIVDLVRDAAS